MPGPLLYLAYGSNLLGARLRERVPGAQVVARFELAGWTLRFDKLGRDGSGKCNIHKIPGDSVLGVLYSLPVDQIAALDRAESGYERLSLEFGEHGEGFTYRALDKHCRAGLRPFDWYLNLVLAGGREHGFPQAWMSRWQGHPSVPDKDADRTRHHTGLVHDAL